jgi:hypothetical protein
MVKIDPTKEDLVPGFSAPRRVFRSMNLEEGDIFDTLMRSTLLM